MPIEQIYRIENKDGTDSNAFQIYFTKQSTIEEIENKHAEIVEAIRCAGYNTKTSGMFVKGWSGKTFIILTPQPFVLRTIQIRFSNIHKLCKKAQQILIDLYAETL